MITGISPEALSRFDIFCDLGSEVSKRRDTATWDLGEMANYALLKGWSLNDFANHVGLEVRSLQNYARLASFYPPDVRASYPMLRYTYFRYAYQFSHGDLQVAKTYLEYAADNLPTCSAFYNYLKSKDTSEVVALREENERLFDMLRATIAYLPNNALRESIQLEVADRLGRGIHASTATL